jgi:hypothetical protein
MRYTLLLFLFLGSNALFSQKILLLERANRAKTTKMYIGERLTFRLAGEENYWYERTITDLFPESNSLMLDGYLVRLDDISHIKVHRRRIWRVIGGALVSFGVSLGVATAAAALYGDDHHDYPLLIGGSVGSFGTGYFLLKKRKLQLDERHRLRIIEIKFEPPLPPKA